MATGTTKPSIRKFGTCSKQTFSIAGDDSDYASPQRRASFEAQAVARGAQPKFRALLSFYKKKTLPPPFLSIFLIRISLIKQASAQQHTRKPKQSPTLEKKTPSRKWITRFGGICLVAFTNNNTPPQRFIHFLLRIINIHRNPHNHPHNKKHLQHEH